MKKENSRGFLLILSILILIVNHSPLLAESKLNNWIDQADKVDFYGNSKTVEYIEFKETYQPSLEKVEEVLNDIYDNNCNYIPFDSSEDNLGYGHIRYRQVYQGIEIEGSNIIVHYNMKSQKIKSINGRGFSDLDKKLGPVVTAESSKVSSNSAKKIALNNLPAKKYAWEDVKHNSIIKYLQDDPNATFEPTPQLVILNQNKTSISNLLFAWKVDIFAIKPYFRYNVFVDANSGQIIGKENKLLDANSKGKALTAYADTQNIVTDSQSSTKYALNEKRNGCNISTQNYYLGNKTAADFIDKDNFWNNVNSSLDQYATDAHLSMETMYDYYFNNFKRKSFDNKNAKILGYVHQFSGLNAFWNSSYIAYGDGDANSYPLTCPDVAGHELTHAYTEKSAGLYYAQESGALNEAFSDIFGTMCEHLILKSKANWIEADQCTKNKKGFRNMADPKSYSLPAFYKGKYWDFVSQEVHTNSNVANYWFYLVSIGDKGTNDSGHTYKVNGVGIEDAGKIAFRTLTVYLSSSSDYAAFAKYTQLSAKDLFGSCSKQYRTVVDALYAISVIPHPFDTTKLSTFSIEFSALKKYACKAPYDIQFTNLSNNATNFTWTFGDGTTSNVISPLHTYSTNGKYSVKLVGQQCLSTKKDSVTKNNFITADSTAGICKAKRIPFNKSQLDTSSLGLLYDSGLDTTYNNNNYGIFTIKPNKGNAVELSFNLLKYNKKNDFLAIYEGPDTSGRLLYILNDLQDVYKLTGSNKLTINNSSITIVESTIDNGRNSGLECLWKGLTSNGPDIAVYEAKTRIPVGYLGAKINSFNKSEPLLIRIVNLGNKTIKNPDLYFSLDGAKPIKESYPYAIYPGDTGSFVFSSKLDLSGTNQHSIKVYCNLGSLTDVNPNNDTLIINSINNLPNKLDIGSTIKINPSNNYYLVGNTQIIPKQEFIELVADNKAARIQNHHQENKDWILFDIASRSGVVENKSLLFNLDLSLIKSKSLKIKFDALNLSTNNPKPSLKYYFRGDDSLNWLVISPKFIGGGLTYKIELNIDSALKSSGTNISGLSQLKIEQFLSGPADFILTEKDVIHSAIGINNLEFKVNALNDIAITNDSLNILRGRKDFTTSLTDTHTIHFILTNNGTNKQSIFPIKYNFDGGSIFYDTIYYSLKQNQSKSFSLKTKGKFNQEGHHNVHIEVNTLNDSIIANNSIDLDFYQVPNPPLALPVKIDFENTPDLNLHSVSYDVNQPIVAPDNYTILDYIPYSCEHRLSINGRVEKLKSNRSIQLDSKKSFFCNGGSSSQSHSLSLNLNMARYQNTQLYFNFDFKYNKKSDTTSQYVKVTDEVNNKSATIFNINKAPRRLGSWMNSGTINLTNLLKANGMQYTKAMKIEFIVNTQNSIINDTLDGGFLLDNINIYGRFNDIAVLRVDSPQSGCGLTSSEPIKVWIKNTGNNLVYTVPLVFDAGLGNTLTETSFSALNPGDSALVKFTYFADFATPGNYPTKIYTALPTDSIHDNDTIFKNYVSKLNPKIIISNLGKSNLCPDDSTLLIINSNKNYKSTLWSNNYSKDSLYVHKSGKYTLTVEGKNGCKVTSNEINIISYPKPKLNILIDKDSVVSNKQKGNYFWYNSNKLINGANSFYIQPKTNGYYSYKLKDSNNCQTSSDSIYFTYTKIVQINNNHLTKIYPNPTTNFITIESGEEGKKYYRFLDMKGAILLNGNFNESIHHLNIENFPKGIYLLELETSQKVISKEIIKN